MSEKILQFEKPKYISLKFFRGTDYAPKIEYVLVKFTQYRSLKKEYELIDGRAIAIKGDNIIDIKNNFDCDTFCWKGDKSLPYYNHYYTFRVWKYDKVEFIEVGDDDSAKLLFEVGD